MKTKISLLLSIFIVLLGVFMYNLYIGSNKESNTTPPIISQIVSPSPSTTHLPPSSITINKLNVNTVVEHVGLDTKNRMDVPKDANNVAWYHYGAKPGEIGNAVIAGHYDNVDGSPSVFFGLSLLEAGNEIEVIDENGKVLTFEVTHKQVFEDATFPIDLIFGPTSNAQLNLITCDGIFDRTSSNYSQRLVVFTKLKS